MNVQKSLLWRIVSACATPVILYCFPGLLKKTLSLLKMHRLLSNSSGVAYPRISKVLIFQHFNSCKRISSPIINDPLHPHHPGLANALSICNTRSYFEVIRCRTSLYKNSLIQSFAFLHVNPK